MKNVCRYIMCLLLAGCILVGLTPVRADALAVEEVSNVAIPADLAIGSALIALGISPGSNDTDFDSLIVSVMAASGLEHYFSDSFVSFIKYKNDDGIICYAVQEPFLHDLNQWLFDVGIVSYTYYPGFGARISADTPVKIRDDGTSIHGNADFIFCPMTTPDYPDSDYCYGYNISTDPDFMCRNQNNVPVCPGRTAFEYNGNTYYYIYWKHGNDLVNPYDANAAGVGFMDALYMAIDGRMDLSTYEYSSSADLTIGTIVPEGIVISGVYESWCESSVVVDGFDVAYYPLALSSDLVDAKSMSQEDMQLGVASYKDGSSDGEPDVTQPSTEPECSVPVINPDTSNRYVDAVSSDFLEGILNEIIDTLPVIIPVSIAVVGITKGIDFLISVFKRG